MAKPNKQPAATNHLRPDSQRPSAQAHAAVAVVHPPAKSPTLLAVSIILFALWFVFLLVTALVG